MNSVEGRVPFLDKDLVEYMFSIDGKKKVRLGNKKIILKNLARRYLPGFIINKPKQGFSLPMALWMRGRLGDRLIDLISSYKPVSLEINTKYPLTLLKLHRGGIEDYSRQLWTFFQFYKWLRENNL